MWMLALQIGNATWVYFIHTQWAICKNFKSLKTKTTFSAKKMAKDITGDLQKRKSDDEHMKGYYNIPNREIQIRTRISCTPV